MNAKIVFEMPECCADCKLSNFDATSVNNFFCNALQEDCPKRGKLLIKHYGEKQVEVYCMSCDYERIDKHKEDPANGS